MKGRKPIPTTLHKARGTLRATRHKRDRAGEPLPVGDLVQPPDWLSDTQKETWAYAIEHAPAGLMKKIDLSILLAWVVAYDHHRIATVAQAKFDVGNGMPLLMKAKGGVPDESPWINVINKSAMRMIRAAAELGFSPAARPRIAAGKSAHGAVGDGDGTEAKGWGKLRLLTGGKEG